MSPGRKQGGGRRRRPSTRGKSGPAEKPASRTDDRPHARRDSRGKRPPQAPAREPARPPARIDLTERERWLLRDKLSQIVAEKELEAKLLTLVRYLELVREWNVRGNLISAGDNVRIVERHALDALAVVPILDDLQAGSVLDLGSGGGFPGIPIKICRPGLELYLVESRRLKSLFLLRAVRTLNLRRAVVWQSRIEHLGELPLERTEDETLEFETGAPSGTGGLRPDLAIEAPSSRPVVDLVTARAVARLARVATWCEPLVREGGYLLTFKGSRLEEELAEWRVAPRGWELSEIREEFRPQTHVVILRRVPSA